MIDAGNNSSCPNRFVVGLTGGIGSGKTSIAELFAARGATIIDTDLIAHQLTGIGGKALSAIRAQFGESFITSEGAMNRPKMREVVFADLSAKAKLEAILHPLIRAECELAAKEATGIYPMFVVPLLVESGSWRQRVYRVLVIDCPEQLQITRVMHRNGFTEQQVRAIMATQASRETRLAAADDVILNDGDMNGLVPQVDKLHAQYAYLAQRKD